MVMHEPAQPTQHKPSNLLLDYVTKKEIAGAFRVSERTIERWVRLRLIPAPVKLGRTNLYHIPTVQRFLAEQAGGEHPCHRQRRRVGSSA